VLLVVLLVVVTFANASDKPPPLRHMMQQHKRFIGSAANHDSMFKPSDDQKNYTTTLADQFSLLTPENEMKWEATEPSRGQFTFKAGDDIVAFARRSQQTVRGHNLCWRSYNPSWLENGKFSPNEKRNILTNHITNVVNHYKGQLYAWDVVNEAISDIATPSQPLAYCVWYPDIPEYVELAFRTAKAADPDVKLFYNDYYIEDLGRKSNITYEYIKLLLMKGVSIHGIGLQMHYSTDFHPDPVQVKLNMQRYAALGLEVHITEMDVTINLKDNWDRQMLKQADVYGSILSACLEVPACKSFEMWGFTDRHSWEASKYPLIFSGKYEPKPSFWRMVQILQ